MSKLSHHPFVIRLLHWEYWNSKFVYFPLYPYWLWLSLKARSFFFLTAANPAIRNGGFIMESKYDVYQLLPENVYPATCYFEQDTDFYLILRTISAKAIKYPCIAKPDIGERGLAVKKINSESEFKEYSAQMPVAFLVQQYVQYEKEVGIFYYRMPWAENGVISGIVHKEPVAVVGDGVSTLQQLADANKRYVLQRKAIQAIHGEALHNIPAKGERVVLVPYGNHSRGSLFTDVSHLVTDKLTNTIDTICKQVNGFYFGRLDVRYNDWASLEDGTALSIIELNGSGSEPTHIYDPKHSIFFAWKEIVRHWNIMYRICKENVKRGAKYTSLHDGRKDIKTFRRIDALLSAKVW